MGNNKSQLGGGGLRPPGKDILYPTIKPYVYKTHLFF